MNPSAGVARRSAAAKALAKRAAAAAAASKNPYSKKSPFLKTKAALAAARVRCGTSEPRSFFHRVPLVSDSLSLSRSQTTSARSALPLPPPTVPPSAFPESALTDATKDSLLEDLTEPNALPLPRRAVVLYVSFLLLQGSRRMDRAYV